MKSVIKKAVKKLKLWSKKRSSREKKKRHHDAYYTPPPPLPPPPYHYHLCSSSSSTQPSAPPLPVASNLWLETEHKYNINYGTFLAPPEEANYHAPEIAMPMDPSPAYPVPPSGDHHQYSVSVSVSEPAVYGIPVVPLIQTTRSRAGSSVHFGFVLGFCAYLFQCLCPCFHSHT